MLVIRVELWPGGDPSEARLLAGGYIINDGSGTRESGNYQIAFRERSITNGRWKPSRYAAVKAWPRLQRGPLALLKQALAQPTQKRSPFLEERGL